MPKSTGGIAYKTVDRGDLRLIEPLWKELNRQHMKNSSHFRDRYRNFRFEDRISILTDKVRGDLLLVLTAWAEGRKQPVGYCISSVDYLGGGEIDSIFVLKEFRKAGVGRELMERSMAWLVKQKPKSLKVTVAAGNEEVFGFYGKFGFLPAKTVLERKK